MTPAQDTATPRPSICIRVYLDADYVGEHPDFIMEDFTANPSGWEYELAPDASQAVKVAGEQDKLRESVARLVAARNAPFSLMWNANLCAEFDRFVAAHPDLK